MKVVRDHISSDRDLGGNLQNIAAFKILLFIKLNMTFKLGTQKVTGKLKYIPFHIQKGSGTDANC